MKMRINKGNPIRVYRHPREVVVHPITNTVEIFNENGSVLEKHVAKMKRLDECYIIQAKTLYGVLPLMDSNLEHADCKVFKCIKFNTEKNGWGF